MWVGLTLPMGMVMSMGVGHDSNAKEKKQGKEFFHWAGPFIWSLRVKQNFKYRSGIRVSTLI
jgi:hypothetical protein